MDDRRSLGDPWVVGGVLLLLLLSSAVLLLYRAAPRSAEQLRTGAWIAARPGAFAPQRARAQERLRAAEAAAAAGDDTLALAAYTDAAAAGWRARDLAASEAERAEATRLWGGAVLGWADLLRRAGTGAGLRRDDAGLLQSALALVQSALSVPLPPDLAQRADAMRREILGTLRFGPLEWLPLPR